MVIKDNNVFCDKECCRKWFAENVSKENWEMEIKE